MFIAFDPSEIIEPELVIVTLSDCLIIIVLCKPCIFASVSTIIVASSIPSGRNLN